MTSMFLRALGAFLAEQTNCSELFAAASTCLLATAIG